MHPFSIFAFMPPDMAMIATILTVLFVGKCGVWLFFLATDFLVLPFLPRGVWQRPWCWLFGHIEGEDWAWTAAEGPVDICTRCGLRQPADED